jgi:hypothetical protein
MAWTRVDGWVWVFACTDHYTAEAWAHVAKVGDRFAALQPVCDAVTDRWGQLGPDVARGLELRHDGGPGVPLGPLHRLAGLARDHRQPGVPWRAGDRRLRRALDPHPQRPVPVVQLHDTVDELRQAVVGFVARYNTSWLIQRHGHRTPKEAYQAAQPAPAA